MELGRGLRTMTPVLQMDSAPLPNVASQKVDAGGKYRNNISLACNHSSNPAVYHEQLI